MGIKFNFSNIQTNRVRPTGYKFPIGLSRRPIETFINVATNSTGGTQTISGTNAIHTFTTSAPTGFTPSFTGTIDYLVVGGGGGGGGFRGGGGGGGAVVMGNISVTSGTPYGVTIGAGGDAGASNGSTPGTNGGNTTFSVSPSKTAPGGTFGTPNEGAGGPGGVPGGGKGGTGSNFPVAANNGTASAITGESTFYGGGGGGGGYWPLNQGGSGGGGNGAGWGDFQDFASSAGAANRGGGGGGGGGAPAARGAKGGGSGVVIVSYVYSSPTQTPTPVID